MSVLLPTKELKGLLGAGFVRLADGADSLWVSDAPRRLSQAELQAAEERLREKGFLCRNTERRLLAIDLSPERYGVLLASLHAPAPAFPAEPRLWPVYELARLLLRRPALPLDAQSLPFLRQALKAVDMPRLAAGMMAGCAAKLRRKEPLPGAVGPVLADWLAGTKEDGI